jgi:hypothetical protein
MKKLIVIFFACSWIGCELMAQVPVRKDDQFWAKRVVRRIDLREKVNRPMINHESSYYSGGKYSERNGLIATLLNGLKRREYVAYDPYDWSVTLDYEAITTRMEAFEQALTGSAEAEEAADYAKVGSLEEFGLETEDEWGAFEDESFSDLNANSGEGVSRRNEFDLAPYEEVVHLVEDWIFNKNRASMQQNIDFFEVIWSDPSGMLPEKVLGRFMWKDVKDILERAQWKNRFNDAEVRSLREVFELRIFRGYPISVGGVPIRSLSEAQKRELEMIEFEHHLWSY